MEEKRDYHQIFSSWKFKNLLVFIVIIIIFGTVILSSVQLREEGLKESKIHNTKSTEAMEKKVFIEKTTKIKKDIDIEVDITTIQYGIVLNRPVYWKKNIKLSEPANVSIEIPSTATNISIIKLVIGNATLNETGINITEINETISEEINITEEIEINQTLDKTIPDVGKNISKKTNVTVNKTDVNITEINETISEETDKKVKEETKNKSKEIPGVETATSVNKSKKKEILVSITANVILRNNIKKPMFGIFALLQKIFRLTGLFLIEDAGEENIIIEIDEIVQEVEISYETPAPYAIEKEQENKKFITIFGPENIHYENVLAFTELPKEVPESAIRLYHTVNETRVEVETTKYDLNNNSLIDYVEWIVPYLSNQSYELIIEVSKAEHLDENRTFIEDVYEEVKAKDNSWIEIPAQHYLRVTFNQDLTSERDITIYARSNGSAEIEVYRQNDSELIIKFENISDENWYKVYLNNLNESNDVFDLRILSGDIEFDYVVDPASAYNISFVSPTPPNDTTTTNTSIEINVSITNASDLNEVIYNWDGTNYTMYNDSLVLMMNFDNVSALGENDTYVVDVSGYGNNGTTSGNPVMNLTGGKYGGAFEFDGVGDYVGVTDAGTSLDFDDQGKYTFEFWIKPEGYHYSGGAIGTLILSKSNTGNGYTIRYSNGIIRFDNPSGGYRLSTNTISLNEWGYVAIVYNTNESIKFYINGVFDSDGTNGAVLDNTGNAILISSPGGGFWADPFNGTIDEVRIWNRSLSADEIQQQYFSNLHKYDTDKWTLYINQSKNSTSGLDDGDYTYFASIKDKLGNENVTETRIVTIDTTYPNINFMLPTLANATAQSANSVYVNVSTSDNNEHSAFIDWDRSLVGWWKFDEYNSTGIYDNSTYDNFGSFQGGLGTSDVVSGKRGMGLEFDGVDDYVNISTDSSIDDISSKITVEMWLKGNPQSGWGQYLFRRGDRYITPGIYIQGSSTDPNLQVVIETSAGETYPYINSVLDNTWHHIAVVLEDGTYWTYTDGVSSTGSYNVGDGFGGTVGLTIGGYVVSGNFNGTIDEVMIFNRVLTPEEINASFNAGSYRLYKNFTDLSDGTYDYTAHVIDAGGNVNQTEMREVTVDTTYPQINFTSPTPPNGTTTTNTSIEINVSITNASDLNEVIYNWVEPIIQCIMIA